MSAGNATVGPQPSCGEVSKETLASDSDSGLKFYQVDNRLHKILGAISAMLAAAALLVCCYSYRQMNIGLVQPAVFPPSCREVKGQTGLYKIKTHSYFNEYPVYCDMETDGGGWTLVAAVHENNIDGKCTSGDKWSSEQGMRISKNYNGSKNWENKNIFGNIGMLTNDDYKNSAYYDLKAKNVMIWHVPNQVELQDLSDKAFLKYYTNNNFLAEYGSTLQTLFANHAPLVHAGSYRFFTLLAPPVTFVKGSNDTIMQGVPISQRDFVQPGYLQFRAFDARGFPNALCPGLRMVAGDSSRVCIGGGGITSGVHHGYIRKLAKNNCGDFAGWGGLYNDAGSRDKPSATGKSLNDISSSILIFVK